MRGVFGGYEGNGRDNRARRECCLEAFDAGKESSGHTIRVCRSGRLPRVDAVRVCSSGFPSGAGTPRQDYPATLWRSGVLQLEGA